MAEHESDGSVTLGRVALYAVIAAGFFYASVAVANITIREKIVDELMVAVANDDVATLMKAVVWPEMQVNVKKNITDKIFQIKESGVGNVPAAKLSVFEINKVVDYYVQPESVEILLRIKKGYAAEYDARRFVKKLGFHGLTGFYVTFSHPEPNGGNTSLRVQEVKIYFEMRGMEWKAVSSDIPLIFIPTYIPQ